MLIQLPFLFNAEARREAKSIDLSLLHADDACFTRVDDLASLSNYYTLGWVSW
jgi:hypothetical protein